MKRRRSGTGGTGRRQFIRLFGFALQVTRSAGKRQLVAGIVLRLAQGLALAVAVISGKLVLDGLLAQAPRVAYGPLVGGLVASGFAGMVVPVLTYNQSQLRDLAAARALGVVATIAASAPLERFESESFYEELFRAEAAARSKSADVVGLVMGLVQGVSGLLAVSVGLATIEPVLPLIVLATSAPVALLLFRAGRDRYDLYLQLVPASRRLEYLWRLLTGRSEAAELRAFGAGQRVLNEYEMSSRKIAEARRHAQRNIMGRALRASALSAVAAAPAVAVLVWLLVSGAVSASAAAAAFAGISLVVSRAQQLATSVASASEVLRYFQDVQGFLHGQARDTLVGDRASTATAAPLLSLSFRGVSFRYPGTEVDAVRSVNIDLRPGTVTALVGPNGAGKTTIAKLAAMLYRPTSGTVLWNGRNAADLQPDALDGRRSLILQDFVRYKLTVRDNIAFGDPLKPLDQVDVFNAAREAGCESLIASLPQGFETILAAEFGGQDLSVGQWQKIALARALVSDAELLILDEPTAALDAQAEREFFDRVISAKASAAVLLISHRLSAVRDADEILVVVDGRIMERGTHANLIATGGHYARMYRDHEALLGVAER